MFIIDKFLIFVFGVSIVIGLFLRCGSWSSRYNSNINCDTENVIFTLVM